VIARPDDRGPRRAGGERRSNIALRELLDELTAVARHLSNHAATMAPTELAYARERLEWLAGEIWAHATGEPRPPAP
jgi:hypothetical protein